MDDELHMIARAKLCGQEVELKEYRIPIRCGVTPPPPRPKDVQAAEDREEEKRKDNLARARETVRELIWVNETPYTKFVTLTYAKTCLDVRKVRRDVTTFVQSMRRMGYDMRYLYVLEHQKERGKKEGNAGSLHVHMVLFLDVKVDLDYLRKAWPHCPHPDIKKTRAIRNLGAYVCKYITKENLADFGKRTFSCSLGLNRPVVERFYKEGMSDRAVGFGPEAFKKAMAVTYTAERSSDYRSFTGDIVWQHTKTTKGILIDPMVEFIMKKGDIIDVI